MGIPRKSGGRVPLSLAVKMLWRYRSKGNKWQENKSQGVEFCDSAGETALLTHLSFVRNFELLGVQINIDLFVPFITYSFMEIT